jgi:hypothetical protein
VGLRKTVHQLSAARGRLAAVPASLQLASATLCNRQPPISRIPAVSNLLELDN